MQTQHSLLLLSTTILQLLSIGSIFVSLFIVILKHVLPNVVENVYHVVGISIEVNVIETIFFNGSIR